MRTPLLFLAAAAFIAVPASAQEALLPGAPLPTPVIASPSEGGIVITQSASMTIEGGGVACASSAPNPPFTTQNSYLRVFNLADHGVTGPISVTSVDVGMSFGTAATASDVEVTTQVILHTLAPGTPSTPSFPRGSLTEVARVPFIVDTGNPPGVYTADFSSVSAVFQPTDRMVVEWWTPEGNDPKSTQFNIRYGQNGAGQTGPTYIATEESCGPLPPTDVSTIGAFGDLHWVVAVNATPLTAAEGGAEGRFVSLGQSAPNPARGSAVIPFEVREASDVRLAVYDVLGREVAVLVDGALAPGAHSATFDAAGLPAGTYVYRLQAASDLLSGRLSVTH